MTKTVHNSGFSLIEVNLAIMIVAVGLLALFALFPLGLRESEAGIADTQEAMFADTVLSALEGNALAMTNWSHWDSTDAFQAGISSNLPYPEVFLQKNPDGAQLEYPSESGKYIRYYLEVDRLKQDDPSRWRANLRVMAGEYGNFKNASVFYTEFIYLGM